MSHHFIMRAEIDNELVSYRVKYNRVIESIISQSDRVRTFVIFLIVKYKKNKQYPYLFSQYR